MGGLGAILSICCIPAWMALSSVSSPSKSSMALVFLFPPMGADGTPIAPTPPRGSLATPSGNEAALELTLLGSCNNRNDQVTL